MKRITTLLALVALVLAFLALQAVQAPGTVPRLRAKKPAQPAACTESVDLKPAAAPAVKAAPQSAIESAPRDHGAGQPVEPEMVPQERPPAPELANPVSHGPAQPEAPQTSAPAAEENPLPKQLTPEEKELAEKRSDRRASLNWLRDHQCEDGRWSASDFGAASTRKDARHTFNVEFFAPGQDWGDKGQSPDNDLVVTALALLGYVGAGYDHREDEYKSHLRKAVLWLRKQQHESGRFGEERDNAFLPTHALCTAAMCEIYSLSGDRALQTNCELALAHLLTLQTKESGFARWPSGYGLDAESDLATTAWSVLALKTAKYSGLEYDIKPVAAGVMAFIDSVTSVVHGADDKIIAVVTKLRERGGDGPEGRAAHFTSLSTLDAMNCYCRCMLASDRFEFELCKTLALQSVENAPAWEETSIDFVHWFFATSAAFQCLSTRPTSKDGKKLDKGWSNWEKALVKVLLEHQRGYKADELKTWPAMLDEFGSWDAVDAYSRQGGRVYTTAVANLCLQIYYRYKRQTKD